MITHTEERWFKDKCKTLGVESNTCSALMSSVPFSTLNAEAEFWLRDKEKRVTDRRIEILVNKADTAMEDVALDIEEHEENW